MMDVHDYVTLALTAVSWAFMIIRSGTNSSRELALLKQRVEQLESGLTRQVVVCEEIMRVLADLRERLATLTVHPHRSA